MLPFARIGGAIRDQNGMGKSGSRAPSSAKTLNAAPVRFQSAGDGDVVDALQVTD
jgi:hypothetical protein